MNPLWGLEPGDPPKYSHARAISQKSYSKELSIQVVTAARLACNKRTVYKLRETDRHRDRNRVLEERGQR